MTIGELYCEKIALLIGGINQRYLRAISPSTIPGIRQVFEHFDGAQCDGWCLPDKKLPRKNHLHHNQSAVSACHQLTHDIGIRHVLEHFDKLSVTGAVLLQALTIK